MDLPLSNSSTNHAIGNVSVVEKRVDKEIESPPQNNYLYADTFLEFEKLLSLGSCAKPDAIYLYGAASNPNNATGQAIIANGANFYGYNAGNVCYFVGTFTNVNGSIQATSNGVIALVLLREQDVKQFAVQLNYTPASPFSQYGTTIITVTWTITFTGYSASSMMYLANGFFQGVGQKIDMMGVTTNGQYPVGSGSHYKFWTLTTEPAFHWSKTIASHNVLEARVLLDGNPEFFPDDYIYTHIWLQLGAYTYDVKPLDNTSISAYWVGGRRIDLRIDVHLTGAP